jgi:hypothetical protein
VLGVTGLGETVEEARRLAYRGVSAISWPGMQARSDIAADAAEGSGARSAVVGAGAGGVDARTGVSR